MDVKALRRELKLTQEKLADLMPTSKRTVIRWEQKHNAPSPLAKARLRALKAEHAATAREALAGADVSASPRRRELTVSGDDSEPAEHGGVLPSVS